MPAVTHTLPWSPGKHILPATQPPLLTRLQLSAGKHAPRLKPISPLEFINVSQYALPTQAKLLFLPVVSQTCRQTLLMHRKPFWQSFRLVHAPPSPALPKGKHCSDLPSV